MPYSHQCPQCAKPVDPLRARAVALIDGQFLYFCSSSCRERQRTGREATVEVTAQQIIHADDSSKEVQIIKPGALPLPEPTAEMDTSLGPDAGTGSGLVRWAIAAIVVLLTAGGMVFWLLPRL